MGNKYTPEKLGLCYHDVRNGGCVRLRNIDDCWEIANISDDRFNVYIFNRNLLGNCLIQLKLLHHLNKAIIEIIYFSDLHVAVSVNDCILVKESFNITRIATIQLSDESINTLHGIFGNITIKSLNLKNKTIRTNNGLDLTYNDIDFLQKTPYHQYPAYHYFHINIIRAVFKTNILELIS